MVGIENEKNAKKPARPREIWNEEGTLFGTKRRDLRMGETQQSTGFPFAALEWRAVSLPIYAGGQGSRSPMRAVSFPMCVGRGAVPLCGRDRFLCGCGELPTTQLQGVL